MNHARMNVAEAEAEAEVDRLVLCINVVAEVVKVLDKIVDAIREDPSAADPTRVAPPSDASNRAEPDRFAIPGTVPNSTNSPSPVTL